MASIFPNKPVGSFPPTVLKTFRFLKALPDDYLVWHHLAPWQQEMPDFLVITPQRQAIIVKVSDATSKQVQSRLQMILLGSQHGAFGENEARILLKFNEEIEKLSPGPSNHHNHVRNVVICPNLTCKQLEQIQFPSNGFEIVWLGKEYLDQQSIDKWNALYPADPLDDVTLYKLRALFTPEVVVPGEITVRRQTERNLQAGLQDFLLDYDQELVLKTDLELSQEAEHIAKDFQISLANGVAGSGKTLIILYRLRLLVELYPSKRFLVLTHNRALIRDMKEKFWRLHGELPDNIKWHTFYSFIYHNWPSGKWIAPLGKRRRDELIRSVWVEYFRNTNITERMLRSEIDWINDQARNARDDYLSAQRRGRGFRLTQQQRELMYAAYERYTSKLRQQNTTDWGEIPRLYLQRCKKLNKRPPVFDVVMIDEAQFFAPIWFEIVQKLVRPRLGHLFIVADPSQGFLNRGVSWKSLGIEVRGHAYTLRHSYRTTEDILTFATIFYRQRVPTDDEEDQIIEPDLDDMPDGVIPELISSLSAQDEVARVVNEVEGLIKQGIPKDHILIMHTNWKGVDALIQQINSRLGFHTAADPKDNDPGDYVRVTTINRGTGLESPIVFLVGLNQLIEEEQSLRLTDSERELVILENTRKIYMALTRAGQRLVVTYVGSLPEDLQWLFQ